MQAVCVFCGSSHGRNPVHTAAARRLGRILAGRRLRLVYGGGNVGLMGEIADAVLQAGGAVDGVIPQALVARELAHAGLTRLFVVDTMHQRKAKMAELSDAFIALPGGFGTLEEFCEVLTWSQLGLHAKPCGLLNSDGYYDPLLTLLDRAVQEEFVRPVHRELVVVHREPEPLLDRLAAHVPPHVGKWIGRDDL